MTTTTPSQPTPEQPYLTPKQQKFRAALAEQMDVLRVENVAGGVVRMVILPQGDLPVDIETINVALPQGGFLQRQNVGIDCRVQGFMVSPLGVLLGVQELSNHDTPSGKPVWLIVEHAGEYLTKLQEGLS